MVKSRFRMLLAVVLAASSICVAAGRSKSPNHKVITLKHLSAQKAQEYVSRLRMGAVSKVPGKDSLLVTSTESDLPKALAVLELLDTDREYVMGKLGPMSGERPSNGAIESALGDVSIGTFGAVPSNGKDLAIIDVHRNVVVVIMPADRVEDIVKTIGRLSKASKPNKSDSSVATAAEMADANQPGRPAPGAGKEPADTEAEQDNSAAMESTQTSDSNAPQNKLVEPNKAANPIERESEDEAGGGSDAEKDAMAAMAALLEDGNLADAPRKEGEMIDIELPEPIEPAAPNKPEPAEPATVNETVEPNEPATRPDISKADLETTEKAPAPGPDANTGQAAKIERPQSKTIDLSSTSNQAKTKTPAEMVSDENSYKPDDPTGGNNPLKVTLPDKMSVESLMGLVGEYMNLDYMYEPKDIAAAGEVTLKLQGKLRGNLQVKDLYPLLESVLKFKGLAMSRVGNVVTVVKQADIGVIDPMLMVEGGKVRHGDVVITRVFKLQHIETSSAKNLLTTMKLGVTISDLPENQTLIVTGYAYRMNRIEQLLAMIDKPGKPREFRYRQLQYTMAKSLAPTVKSLAEQLGEVTVSVSVSSTTTAAPAGETEAMRRARLAREAAARRAEASRSGGASAPTAPDAVFLDADERTNRILMIGNAEQLEIVEQLIDTLDVAQQDLRHMKLYKIKHVDAEEVRKKMSELGIISGSGGYGSNRYGSSTSSSTSTTAGRTTAPNNSGPSRTTPSSGMSATADALVEEPQVVVIEATNSLLVNATDEQHNQMAAILAYIDQETDEGEIPYKIYPLENQKPEDLAGVLEQLVKETIQDKEGKVEKVVQRQEDTIVIVPDENTFSLIVYASKKNQEWIANLIEQLDKRRPQVLIDVALVEITRNDLFEYDLNIIANAQHAVAGNQIIGVDSLLKSTDTILEGGWNVGGSGSTTGFYGSEKIQALFTAMDRKDYGRILAQPKVLVNDNEQGVISTNEKTYVQEDTTVYTDQGVPVTSSKWTEYPAKIELSITPNISEGDLLRLEIDMTREDFEKKQDAPPDYRTSQVTTVVTVPDGSTIILGGLTKLNQTKNRGKVPLLGDIPLVGGLFSGVSNSDKANKLYIFVRANILRPDETSGMANLEKISRENREAFEEAERMFQQKQDWPGLDSKPMEPVKVLGDIN